ncbi:MAG: toll/interleukin-1 receptor domain-containing protein [Hyphomonadaceae bacterium]|nr:toll/interleukin-1 receptor domain-containing protein [Hyphomonadaceae bacterium]
MARQQSIFIGYRRDDTADVAGRIYDALARRFGRDRLFKDVDNLKPGADFGAYIGGVLPKCRVFLALIGPNWLDSRDEDGRRRLDDPGDWVRVEIETALSTKGLTVVPVLVNGARMPRAEEVPESMRGLLRLHAATVRRDPDFHDDIRRMGEAIRDSLKSGALDLTALGAGVTKTDRGEGGGGSKIALTMVALAGIGGAAYFLAPQMTQTMWGEGSGAAIEAPAPADPVSGLVGQWSWSGASCSGGAKISRDGDLVVVAMPNSPLFTHAIEEVRGDTVHTIIVTPEALRGTQYQMTPRGSVLEIKSMADGSVETWRPCTLTESAPPPTTP